MPISNPGQGGTVDHRMPTNIRFQHPSTYTQISRCHDGSTVSAISMICAISSNTPNFVLGEQEAQDLAVAGIHNMMVVNASLMEVNDFVLVVSAQECVAYKPSQSSPFANAPTRRTHLGGDAQLCSHLAAVISL